MAPKSSPRVLYWFRTDLRLHDSPALKAALDLNPEVLYPIWCWDPHYIYRARVGPNRFQFLYVFLRFFAPWMACSPTAVETCV